MLRWFARWRDRKEDVPITGVRERVWAYTLAAQDEAAPLADRLAG
jgi:hypothetical protein